MFARGFYNNSARLGIRASTSQGLLFLKLSPEGLVISGLGGQVFLTSHTLTRKSRPPAWI